MKKVRKAILTMLCLGLIMGTVACGTMGNANDNGASDNNNNVTEGTDKTKNGNGNIIDDVGDAVGNGVEDVGEGVKNITDDMTQNNR